MTTGFNDFLKDVADESKKEGPEAESELIAFNEHFKVIAEKLIEKKLRHLSIAVIVLGISMFLASLLTYGVIALKY